MELREFVSQSLIQIVEGVSAAQAHFANDPTIAVNPAVRRNRDVSEDYVRNDENMISDVTYDVQISVEEGSTAGGGARIAIFSASLGGSVETAERSSGVSRLRFKVPLLLPAEIRDAPLPEI
ncbi:MAG: hypothetical protein AAAFM81_11095 [Pseudomonadota bacterium]